MPRRDEMWDRLGGTVDVLIVGGGINGAGIARDAARRGLSVAMVEMVDLAFGTSSRSSKLVHGGLRYLEQYEFSLVFEAVSERRILMDIAPHLVNPLGFIFPIYQGARRKLWFVNAGMWIYDGLSLFRSPKMHRTLSADQLAECEPALKRDAIQGAPLYYDCSTDDARLTLESAIDAAHAGAIVTTYAKVVSFIKDDNGRVAGAIIEDVAGGGLKEVRAHAVVNATGPWTDRTLAMSKPPTEGTLLRPTKGVHIVVDRDKLPINNALVAFHPEDGRVLFAIPWGGATYIGTTDTDYDGDPSAVRADRGDVEYLLDAAAWYYPEHRLSPDDVIATWAGLRPLIKPEGAPTGTGESQVSREHRIIVGQDGLITIAGGKLTTFRRMSEEVVDTVVRLLRLSNRLPSGVVKSETDAVPLPGAVGWPADDDHEHVAALVRDASGDVVSPETARLLANTYGMLGMEVARLVRQVPELARPIVEGRPEIMAQVDWAVNTEMASEVGDVMIRRTQLFYRDADQGLTAADAVGQRMATLLGWSDERRDASIQAYRDTVGVARAWKDDPA